MTRSALATAPLVLALSGCVLVATPQGAGTLGAGLGLGASALDLDTEILKVWEGRHPPKDTVPVGVKEVDGYTRVGTPAEKEAEINEDPRL